MTAAEQTIPGTDDATGGREARIRRFALACAAAHWGLLALVQVEDFWLYLMPTEGRWQSVLGFCASVPFMQGENVAVAVVLGAAAYVLGRRAIAGWAFYAAYLLATAYVVVDQMYYKLFFDHFRMSMAEGLRTLDPSLAASSLVHESDAAVFLNAGLLLLLGSALVVIRPWRATGATPAVRLGRWWSAAVVAFLLGLPSVLSSTMSNLQHHPLLVLLQDTTMSSVTTHLAGGGEASSAAGWSAAAPSGVVSVDERVGGAARAVRAKHPRPNVVLVVMESVGSVQLLGRGSGLPDAAQTPTLAGLAEHGVVFNSVYSVFPGTTRTHVAMQTGGFHLTWGSVYELFPHKYVAPTLPTVFGEAGYRTALFSAERLDGEAMDQFMRQTGYQEFYDFAQDPAAGQGGEAVLNSWGAREEHALGKVREWLARSGGDGRPFFLTYLTVATHHPYSVPEGEAVAFPGRDDVSRYRSAMHYTDAAVGKLLRLLAERGELENTVVLVTGDHGEAFGDLHPRNYTHKYRLYDENVRSFLLVANPAIAGPVVSDRVATTGDILPTAAGVAGVAAPPVLGRDLLVDRCPPRIVFFHKNAYPEQWGLRDGNWKYVGGIRDGSAELYDLSADPYEHRNVAADDPRRVRRYEALCRNWFGTANDQYTDRLEGHTTIGGRGLKAADYKTPGPKVLTVGYRPEAGGGTFEEARDVSPDRPPTAWTRWVSYEADHDVVFEWVSPSAARYRAPFHMSSEWTTTYVPYSGPTPMERGRWSVSVGEPGAAPTLTTEFEVR